MEDNKNISTEEKSNSSNIFSELSWWLDFWDKQQEFVEETKDIWFYLIRWKIFLNILIILWLITVLVFFTYTWIQKREFSKPYLNVVCGIICDDYLKENWEKRPTENCSSLYSLNTIFKDRLNLKKQELWTNLATIIYSVYQYDSSKETPEMIFLKDHSKNRLNILRVLWDFDHMLSEFTWDYNKHLLKCENIKINSDLELTASCQALSTDWETSISWLFWTWIPWIDWSFSDVLKWWTSISMAASFLNFIEKSPEYWFYLLDKQKTFSLENAIDLDNNTTKRTSFPLKLKIINNININ